jgi:hypothetical protein
MRGIQSDVSTHEDLAVRIPISGKRAFERDGDSGRVVHGCFRGRPIEDSVDVEISGMTPDRGVFGPH